MVDGTDEHAADTRPQHFEFRIVLGESHDRGLQGSAGVNSNPSAASAVSVASKNDITRYTNNTITVLQLEVSF